MGIFSDHRFVIFCLFLIFLGLIFFPFAIPRIKTIGYQSLRYFYQAYWNHKTADYHLIEKNDFIVKYLNLSQETAELVLETALEIAEPVQSLLGFQPPNKVPIIIYPSKEELNQSFGWEGDKSAMGVYWMGTISILSPEVWLDSQDFVEKARTFKTIGPMAHEYAHLVVDYQTRGNYPRWFTEGLAQYVEREITGFSLEEPEQWDMDTIYSFDQLDDNFDNQLNQDLAYWQSLMAVQFLVENNQSVIIQEILARLAQNKSLNNVFLDLLGYDLPQFERLIEEYISDLNA